MPPTPISHCAPQSAREPPIDIRYGPFVTSTSTTNATGAASTMSDCRRAVAASRSPNCTATSSTSQASSLTDHSSATTGPADSAVAPNAIASTTHPKANTPMTDAASTSVSRTRPSLGDGSAAGGDVGTSAVCGMGRR